MTRYVIVGNGVAGTTAAEKIRELDREGAITILSAEDTPFYYRIRLPEVVAGDIEEPKIIAKKPDWYRDRSIDLHLQTTVTEADADTKTLRTESGQEFSFDKLLLANGSSSFIPPIQGADTPGVFALRSVQDVRDIRTWAGHATRVVLIGGGLLGLEAGNGLRKLGKEVTVVEFFPRLLPRQLDTDGAGRLQSMLEDMGFSFRLGAKTTSISGEKGVREVHLESGETLPADLVLISAGVRPNLELAKQLGLDSDKGIKVNEHLETSRQGIYAAGDVTEYQGRVYGIWPAAEEQGGLAGHNMAGAGEAYQGTVMANTLKVVGIDLASAGEIDADNEHDSRVRASENSYRKLVLEGGTVIGSIMLGDTSGFQKVTRMMKEQTDVSENIDAILSDS